MPSPSSSSDAPPLSEIPPIANLYDVFISHAGPDKKTMAIPLHEKLEKLGITAFVDEKDMPPGCEAPSAMMRAMRTAAIGVFILSPDFVARKWPVKEMYCFLERRHRAALQRRKNPVLIPVFYRLTTKQCHCIESLLDSYEGGRAFIEGRFIQRQRKGEPEADLDKLQSAFKSLVSYMGPQNLNNVTNEESDNMQERRGRLVDEIVNGIVNALKKMKEEEGNGRHASHSATHVALETKDSFEARFDLPLPVPNMVMNWECDSYGVPVTMEGKLKKVIMDSTQDHDASVVSAVDCYPIGAWGHGGVGKTSALIGVGREKDVQQHFKDGVYFVRVGRDASDAHMKGALAQLVRECGGMQTCIRILDSKSVEGAVQMTGGYFRGKRALFMFDDLWPTEKSEVGYVEDIRQLVATCPQSRILISTRSNDIANAGKHRVQFELRDAEGRVAQDMLCCSAGIEKDEMLQYEKELGVVLRFCKGLPLTLQVAGCAIKGLRDDGVSLRDAIELYVNDLQAGTTSLVTKRSKEYPSFHYTVVVSLRMADRWYERGEGYTGETRRRVSELYERLAVLGRQMHAPRSMLRVLWGLETERETEVLLMKLRDLNLVKRGMKGGEVGVEVHDLLLEFCEVTAGEKVKDYHVDILLEYYKLRGKDAMGSEGSKSELRSREGTNVEVGVRCWWEDGLSRGYIAENVCRHLAGAGECEELAMLLTDARWASAQVRRGRVMGWMGDFDELFGAMQKQKTGGAEVLDPEKGRKGLELVRDAVREAWHFVSRNKREFGWQMYARLVDQGRRGWAVRQFLESTSRHAEKPWLRPKSRGFPVPGGNSVAFPFKGSVTSVAFLDKKAVVGAGREVFVVNLESGEREKTLGERDMVRSVAASGDGRRIVSGHDGGTVRVWDAESGKRVCEPMRGHIGCVSGVAVSGDGRRIVFGSWSSALSVWDAGSGEGVSKTLRSDTREAGCVAMSLDGRRIVSGQWDKTLRVWDAESGTCVGVLRGHTDEVSCVAMSEDGQRIVSGSRDRTLRVWETRSETCVGELLCDHTDEVSCVAMNRDGRRFVSGSRDGTLRVWEARDGTYVGEPFRSHTGKVECVAMSKDGGRILSASSDRTVRVWDTGSKACVGEALRGHTGEVRCMAMSGDERRIVSGSDDKTLRVWEAGSGECASKSLRGHTDTVMCVAMSGDGQRIVSGARDNTLRVWDAGSETCVGEPLRDHTGVVMCVAMSGDGRRIVSGSNDKTLRVWEAGSGEFVSKPLRGHTAHVSCVVMSGDGQRIVSGSWDRTLRVWETRSGECVGKPLRGHTGPVNCLVMSADGRRVVSGSLDGTLRVWDTNSGESVGAPRRYNGWIERIIMTGTTVSAFGDSVPAKWKLDASVGLVKAQGEDEIGLLDVWCSNGSTVVKMMYQGEELRLAALPAAVRDSTWRFDLRGQVLVAGCGNGSVLCSELVL